ncbi:HlyD family type I secretion periplasmic adaptor subunit [Paraferrimonas sp. SM1919]|uniref:HlyD family type I secretion periplasmic adaptor subunit n=1 Tax=Paraferrimonas sp. SM1919 TaxID=2662263 RepID=UPI0013D1ABC2|nr:HlyD family type I secretion periplasmic adaptor subunit [Paraferrimonas sp. SM1919]
MAGNALEEHIKNALVGSNYQDPIHNTDYLSLSSELTFVHKALLVFLAILTALTFVSSQAQLDIIVSARGELLLESDIEKVQHLEGGILDELLIKNGDVVYQGQAIARLKSSDRHTILNTKNLEIVQLKMDLIRYQSLINGLEPNYSEYSAFPELISQNLTSWKEENSKNQSGDQLLLHDIEHKTQLLSSMQNRMLSSNNQLKLIESQLAIKQTLHEEEMASYIEVLNMQVQRSNMQREIENLQEAILNEQFQMERTKKQLIDLQNNRNSEYQAKITEIKKEISIKETDKTQHSDKVARLTIYSPVDGVVDKIHYNYQSAVIGPGESIVDIAPLNDKIHGEAKISRSEIGFVEVGQQVRLKFDSYHFTKYGHIEGKIESISRSSYKEEEMEYYIAKISLQKSFLEKSGIEYKLSPYLEFTVDIKTGERTILEYAIKPVISALEEAFDER